VGCLARVTDAQIGYWPISTRRGLVRNTQWCAAPLTSFAHEKRRAASAHEVEMHKARKSIPRIFTAVPALAFQRGRPKAFSFLFNWLNQSWQLHVVYLRRFFLGPVLRCLSQMTAAAKWMPAMKFLAVLSWRVAIIRYTQCSAAVLFLSTQEGRGRPSDRYCDTAQFKRANPGSKNPSRYSW
jgi:hypothetical protein